MAGPPPTVPELDPELERVCVYPVRAGGLLGRLLGRRGSLAVPRPPLAMWGPLDARRPDMALRPAGFAGVLLYVGRFEVDGNLLPAAVRPPAAFAAWQGETPSRLVKDFEVLHVLRGNMNWVAAADGDVPAHAFPAGLTADGRVVFAARATEGDTVVPGWVLPGDKEGCHVAWQDGSERVFREYEVLSLS